MGKMVGLPTGILLIFGISSSVTASPWVAVWPAPAANQDLTIEDANVVMKRAQTQQPKQPITQKDHFEVRELTPQQEKLVENRNKPQMFEKTKIIQRIRKLKDQGEERTKVVYRTRIIGAPNMRYSDFNYYNNDNTFDWPADSDESISDSQPNKFQKFGEQVSRTFDRVDTDTQTGTAPRVQKNNHHSAKKELRFNMPVTIRSMEVFDDLPKTNQGNNRNLNTNNKIQPIIKQQPLQQQTRLQQIQRPIENNINNRFLNIKDSLEIAMEERKKARQEQSAQAVANSRLFEPNHPVLQRQSAVIEELKARGDNTVQMTEKNTMDFKTLKPILKSNVISQNKIFEENKRGEVERPIDNLMVAKSVQPLQSAVTSVTNTIRPDWIGNLLIKKVNPVAASGVGTTNQYNLNYKV